jgi:hypothetical protein
LADSTGYYEIATGLSTGTYTVTAADYALLQKNEKPGYLTQTISDVSVTSGKESVNNDFNLVASAWISGTVTSYSGMPIFRAKVTATKVGDTNPSTFEYTDIEGKYMMTTGIATGMYTLTATYLDYSDSKSSVQAIEGTETPEVNFQYDTSSLGQIVGRVVDAATYVPLVGVPVEISGQSTYNAITDEKGYYSYLGSAGSYNVESNVPGYYNNATTVNVSADQIARVYYPTAASLGFLVQKFSGSSTAEISGILTSDAYPIPEFPVAAIPVIFSLTIFTLLIVTKRISRIKNNGA